MGRTPQSDRPEAFDLAKLDQAGSTGTLDQRSTFAYTPAGQLASVDKTGADAGDDESYVYDAAGNTTKQVIGAITTTSTFDRDRLSSSAVTGAGTTYSRYDPYGRLISRDNAGQTIERYAYDGFDRTIREQRYDTAGVLQLSKTQSFDPFDHTTSQSTAITGKPTKSLRFTYLGTSDQVAVEEEKNTGGAWEVSKNYAYGPDGSKLQLTDTPVNGTTTKTQYYGTNPHGDVETMTGTDGTTASTYRYTAYGQPDTKGTTGEDAYSTTGTETDKMAADLDNVNPYRFSGKRIHGGTGTYDIGFRDYDPGINRFLTRDFYQGALKDLALGTDPWNTNRYAFAGGNPIGMIELDGHMALAPEGGESVPAPTNSAGCGTWGLPACNPDPERKVDPVVEGMVSTGDGGDAAGGAVNAGTETLEHANPALWAFSALTGINPWEEASDGYNDKHGVDTTTNAYAAGGVAFDIATMAIGGAAAKAAKVLSGAGKAPRAGGAGGDWPTIGAKPGGAVGQSHPLSCASACGEMLGAGREADLMAKAGAPTDAGTIAKAMGDGWQGGYVGDDALPVLMGRGPWMAQMGGGMRGQAHMVVVSGLDDTGNMAIRDPWGGGSTYSMTPTDFGDWWSGIAVFK